MLQMAPAPMVAMAPVAPPMRLNVSVDRNNQRLAKALEKGRKSIAQQQPKLVELSSSPMGIPMAPPNQTAPVVHHITRDMIPGMLACARQSSTALIAAMTSRWHEGQRAMLSGRGADPVVAQLDALLGHVLVSIEKLEAAEHEERGAIVFDSEMIEWERAEKMAEKLGG
jgi:hypothetical protein